MPKHYAWKHGLMLILFLPLGTIILLRAVNPHSPFQSFRFQSVIPIPSSKPLPKLCATPADDQIPNLLPAPTDSPDALKDYITFHAQARKCLSSPSCKSPPILLYNNEGNSGGFGYRLSAIRWALLFAIATRMPLFILWPKRETGLSFDLSTALHPASIDWRPPWDVINKMSSSLDYRAANLSKSPSRKAEGSVMLLSNHDRNIVFRKGVLHHKLVKTNFSKLFEPFDVIYMFPHFRRRTVTDLFKNRYLRGTVFANFSTDDSFIVTLERHLSRALFRPSPAVQDLIEQRIFPPSSPFVSVHMRSGDDLNETHYRRMQFVSSNMEPYADRMLDCAEAIHAAGMQQIFLASDSLAFKNVFIERAALRNVTVRTQTERSSVHLSNYGFHVDHDSNRRAAKEEEEEEDADLKCMQFLDVFADVFPLGRGDALVGRLSSFASEATALGSAPRAVQIYLGVKQKNMECDVEQLVSGEAKRFRFNTIWYESEARKVGRVGERIQFVKKGKRKHVRLFSELVNLSVT